MENNHLLWLADRLERHREGEYMPCPACHGAWRPGFIHGMPCLKCNGSAEVLNPDFDLTIKGEVVDLLRLLANIEPLNDQTIDALTAWPLSLYESRQSLARAVAKKVSQFYVSVIKTIE